MSDLVGTIAAFLFCLGAGIYVIKNARKICDHNAEAEERWPPIFGTSRKPSSYRSKYFVWHMRFIGMLVIAFGVFILVQRL